jgi:hypothetical protein
MKSLLPSATDPVSFGKIIGFVSLLIPLGIVEKDPEHSYTLRRHMAVVKAASRRLEHL